MSVVPARIVTESSPLPRRIPDHSVPLLDNGDRLTRAEYERRYSAMPEVKKAELIEGIVYIPMRPGLLKYAQARAGLIGWAGRFVSETPGVDFGSHCTLRLDMENEPQPDLILRLPESSGGKSRVSDDDYLEGPVEFIAEVAASSVSLDTHAKLSVYRRNGVQEYLIWRVEDQAVDWFTLREGRYESLVADAQGVLRSEVFAGLWLDPASLIRGELGRLFQLLDAGAASAEHANFVARLAPSNQP